MTKAEIRSHIRKLRDAQSSRDKLSRDMKIQKRLGNLPIFKKAKTIAFYLANSSEVDTEFLLKNYLKKKRLLVPKVLGKRIALYEVIPPMEFKEGLFGIREPAHEKKFTKFDEVDLILVPGIAFDLRGHRVGYGGGYFDRLLPKMHGTTIGLAYELQMVDKIPERKYDVGVSYILTDKRLIPCKHSLQSKGKIRVSTKSSKGR